MLSADSTTPQAAAQALYESDEDEQVSSVSLADILTWLGEKKKLIAAVTLAAALLALIAVWRMPPVFTARATFLAPGSQQSSSAAALAAIGALGGLGGGLAGKSSDELYVALLKSD